MKEYGFHIIAFVCIVSLFVTACDKTIHQYPESEKTWVMVELNADRTPPVYYKELTYDAEGESSINLSFREITQPMSDCVCALLSSCIKCRGRRTM